MARSSLQRVKSSVWCGTSVLVDSTVRIPTLQDWKYLEADELVILLEEVDFAGHDFVRLLSPRLGIVWLRKHGILTYLEEV